MPIKEDIAYVELKSVSSSQSVFTRSIFVRFHDIELRLLSFGQKTSFNWFQLQDENLEQKSQGREEQGEMRNADYQWISRTSKLAMWLSRFSLRSGSLTIEPSWCASAKSYWRYLVLFIQSLLLSYGCIYSVLIHYISSNRHPLYKFLNTRCHGTTIHSHYCHATPCDIMRHP